MLSKKRRRIDPPAIHPNNRYSEKPPDFRLLASLYPSFRPYVFESARGRPSIDWTDFAATRELTRVLLRHDHGLEWWIPDGQLCPTVPNRLNYIHWIGDLLSSDVLPKTAGGCNGKVRGFDIGTGANCIYSLLGASLFGWEFIGSDVTDIALEWARKNVENNPHISHLIEIRDADVSRDFSKYEGDMKLEAVNPSFTVQAEERLQVATDKYSYKGPPILVGVLKDDEKFDFCMCNPPFFEQMEEANLNPKTSCGGTHEEMVCPGGELAFISRIIEDSIKLKCNFRWFTSMVGRKANLKILVAKLRDAGVTLVKTTEFVQGQTARWGIAWSFLSSNKKAILSHVPVRGHHSFTLEGLQRHCGGYQVLKAVELHFINSGATCKSDLSLFFINVKASNEQLGSLLKEDSLNAIHVDEVCFRISIYEQIPGTVLVKGSLQEKGSSSSGVFTALIQRLEDVLREQLIKKPGGAFKT